jgi:succinate dehydrogenase assembly factor 1
MKLGHVSSFVMGTTPRLSGLARQALSLHRALLRAARGKSPEARAGIEASIRAEFERHRDLDPRDLMSIEHRIRAGRKKLALIEDPNVKSASGPSR